MKVLFIGAGPLGSLYAHMFQQAGTDVTLLARGDRYGWLEKNGLVLRNEMTGEEGHSTVNLLRAVAPTAEYDLAIVLIRKNKLPAVFDMLAPCHGIQSILFMGNNALGFDDYLKALPAEKLIFGFPGAGGGFREQVVHYADRESPKGKRRAVTLGEIDGQQSPRLQQAKALFENAGVPVDIPSSIDGWLKYHVALVSPFVGALYRHDCDNYETARDRALVRSLVRAAKEGASVLEVLGFGQSEPSEFKLMKRLPEFMSVIALRKMLGSKFAEVAFAMHALSARDEMIELAAEFQTLVEQTSISTPNIDSLRVSHRDF